MRSPTLSIVVSLLLSVVALAGNPVSYPTQRLVFSDDPLAPIGDNFAATKQGNVLYEDKGREVSNPLYKARIGGNIPITVIGSNYAAHVDGPVSMNDAGDVTFQSFSPGTAEHGAFKKGGGTYITLTGSPFGKSAGAPSLNDNGDVIFLSMDAAGAPTLQTRSAGGVTITIHGLDFASAQSRPIINNAMTVAQAGTLADGSQGVIVQSAGGGFTGTISGDWRMISSQPRITENNTVLFAVEGNGSSGIPTGRRSFVAARPNWPGFTFDTTIFASLDNDCDGIVNDSLSVACVDGERLKVFILDPAEGAVTHAEFTLLSIGDPLDGSFVTSLAIGDGSMMPDNSVIFHATLASGASGIYQVMVPEPMALSLSLGSLLLARRRR